MDIHEPQHVVVLVHGTFARSALWTNPDSPVAIAATEALGGAAIAKSFEWSGRNSHAARLAAGTELASYLRSLRTAYPATLQHIVAHSHGGNVTAYALRDPIARTSIGSVVCLGTPFIVAHPRNLEPTISLGKLLGIVGAIALALFFADVAVMSGYLMYLHALGFIFGTVLILLVGALCVLLARVGWRGIQYLEDRLIPRLRTMQSEVVTSLQENFESIPVLSMRVQRDEAAAYLRFVDIIARVPFQLWSPRALLWIVSSLAALVLFSYGILSFRAVKSGEEDAWEMVITLLLSYVVILVISLLVLMVIGAVAQAACVLWPRIFRGHALGFGEEGFMKNYLVRISASSRPTNAERFDDQLLHLTGRGLHHSMLYQDQHSLHCMATWLSTGAWKKGA